MPLFFQSAAEWRRRADELVKQGRYAEAAECYRKEAAIYRKNGDLNGAKVEEAKADRWSSTLKLFAHLPGNPPPIRMPLAKHEPEYGCYIGAFLDRDERLGDGFMANDQRHQDPEAFGEMTGKKLASVFCYLNYGRPFPRKWVEHLKRQGVAPHIAFEPNRGMDVVQDDDYLRKFALEAGQAGCPIFLRFASEMNGDWVRYGGDPAAYKRGWGLVCTRMRQFAPNVAMVWCVNHIPEIPIPRFYPGDDYVDWVGVNFYSVPFYDNDPKRPGLADNPADRLRYVYNTYAPRKPIAICEFGASHFSSADNRDRSDWAAQKIAELYASLPRLYPRVKLVDIFNNDNMKYAQPGRQLNNYSVTDSDVVRTGYSRAVSPEYFLSEVGKDDRPAPIVALGPTIRAPRGILRVSAWARCHSMRSTVVYELDGKRVAADHEPGPREISLRLNGSGVRKLSAVLLDDRGKVATRAESKITIA